LIGSLKAGRFGSWVEGLIDDSMDRLADLRDRAAGTVDRLPDPGSILETVADQVADIPGVSEISAVTGRGGVPADAVDNLPKLDAATEALWSRVPLSIQALLENIDSNLLIFGGVSDDLLVGSRRSDTILADPIVRDDSGGNDLVFGLGGDDIILAFGGENTVLAG